MYFKNIAGQGIYIFARDTVNNVGKTGDAANITLYISKDGAVPAAEVDATATDTLVEVGGGVYWCPLTQAEMNANVLAIWGSSISAGVVIDVFFISTQAGAIPPVAFGGAGGLGTYDQLAAALVHLQQIKGDAWNPSFALDQLIELNDVWTRAGKVRTTPPSDTDPIEEHLAWLSHVARHKVDVNKETGQAKIYDEAGEQVIGIAGVSDDGTLYIRERVIAPS